VLGWLVVGALPSILSVDDVHALRSVQMIPAVFLIAGVAADVVWRWMARLGIWGRPAVAAILAIVLVVQPIVAYFEDWANHPWVTRAFDTWLVDAAALIDAAPRGKTRWIAVPFSYLESDMAAGIPVVIQPIPYLTRSYTEADRRAGDIQYVVQQPDRSLSPKDFCDAVRAQHRDGEVFCVAFDHDLLAPLLPMR
jgi:hypothetical protein